MSDQISGHPMAQSRRHIKLTITVLFNNRRPFSLTSRANPIIMATGLKQFLLYPVSWGALLRLFPAAIAGAYYKSAVCFWRASGRRKANWTCSGAKRQRWSQEQRQEASPGWRFPARHAYCLFCFALPLPPLFPITLNMDVSIKAMFLSCSSEGAPKVPCRTEESLK